MLTYSESGHGPSIVFLHGLASDRHKWDPFLERLSAEFHCVAVDLPGHGDSPEEGSNGLEAAVAIDALVKDLGLENQSVVGHSLGATVALLYSAMYQHRSAVMIDPVGLYLPDMVTMVEPFAQRLVGKDFETAFLEFEAMLMAPVPEAQRVGLQADIKPNRNVVLSYWETLLTPGAAEATQPSFSEAMAAIELPTLILLATEPSANDQQVLDQLPQATVEIHEGATHFMHLLDPVRYAERIRQWMHSLP